MVTTTIRTLTTLLLFSFCASCSESTTPTDVAVFRHEISGTVPWVNEDFDANGDKFTFAIHSDLTGGERERIFEIAVAQLALLRPEFIISVGDLIEGAVAQRDAVNAEWDSYDERARRAKAPVFYVGGNHDLTGQLMQDVWDERHGRRYYHFRYKDVLFLVLDTEDNTPERSQEVFEIRSEAISLLETVGREAFEKSEYFSLPERNAGNITAKQSKYFVDVIAANPDVRWTFLFFHKSPWLKQGEENFAAIEHALANRPYTVFHGHFHAYRHQQRNGNDYIRLATTGGVQLSETERAVDHVTLVTVDDTGVDIANLLLQGILDKTGHIPLNGDDVCFEATRCPESE